MANFVTGSNSSFSPFHYPPTHNLSLFICGFRNSFLPARCGVYIGSNCIGTTFSEGDLFC